MKRSAVFFFTALFLASSPVKIWAFAMSLPFPTVNNIGSSEDLTKLTHDNLTSLTDAEGNETRFEYNGNNQVTKETRPMGEETTYEYDEAGNLTRKVDPKNQATEYAYDLAGRLTETKFYDNTAALVKTVGFDYDATGNLTGYSDGVSSATYVYDAQGRKTQETVDYGTFTLTYGYTYDTAGKKTSVTYPDGSTYAFTYNQNAQLSSYQIPNMGLISIQYQWNRPNRVIYPGGVVRETTYDPEMRTSAITVKDPGGNPVMTYNYGYDNADNITSKQTEHGNYAFGYDRIDQLTSVQYPAVPGLPPSEQFDFDKVGNRTGHMVDDVFASATFNKNNEVETSSSTAYEHDANGNLISKTVDGFTTIFEYDTENRLIKALVPAQDGIHTTTATYTYDPFFRRLSKTITTSSGASTTFYAYADEGLIAEVNASGEIIKSYGYQPNGLWGTNPIWMNVINSPTETNGYHWFANDHLGSPQKMTAPNGAVTWAATYDVYGNATVDTSNSTVVNNLRFPGQYADRETGLHYNFNRYFDPSIGRYITIDPLSFDAGDDLLYRYASGNPASFIDPNGQLVIAAQIIIRGLLLGGAYIYFWYINNNPPKSFGFYFPSRQDDEPQICPIESAPPDPSTPVGRRGNPARVPTPSNTPTSIGGRNYTGHAQDQMQGRGIPPSAVEEAIQNGEKSPGNQPGTTEHHDSKNDITVVTNKNGDVVTVKHGEPKAKEK